MKIKTPKYSDIVEPLLMNIEAAALNIIGLEAALVEAELDEDFEFEIQVRANLEYNKAVRASSELALHMVN